MEETIYTIINIDGKELYAMVFIITPGPPDKEVAYGWYPFVPKSVLLL